MSGRIKRRWDRQNENLKNLHMLMAKNPRLFNHRREPKVLDPEAYPLCGAQDIWTYRGVTCVIVPYSWNREEDNDNEIQRLMAKSKMLEDVDIATSKMFRKMADDMWKRSQNFNGYAIFQKRVLATEGYEGFASYIPVHGGITFAEPYVDGEFCYGFDTQHLYDEDNPLPKDKNWVKEETERMVMAIQAARKFERRYIRARTKKGKARVIAQYLTLLEHHRISQRIENNFGATLKLLSGQI